MSEEHHDHSKHYIKLYWTLMALFAVSVAGPMVGIKAVTLITAFGIAGVKAYIVIAHFMHLKGEKQFVIYLLTASVGLMFLFYFAAAPDVHNHEGRNWINTSAASSVERGLETAKREEAEHGHGSHGEAAEEAHGHDHAPVEGHGDQPAADQPAAEEPAAEEPAAEEAHGHDHAPEEGQGTEAAGH